MVKFYQNYLKVGIRSAKQVALHYSVNTNQSEMVGNLTAIEVLSFLKILEQFKEFNLQLYLFVRKSQDLQKNNSKEINALMKSEDPFVLKEGFENFKRDELYHVFQQLYQGQLIVEIAN